MTTRPTITAAVIALNEEQNLPGLLASLAWVDEIVVVDGGSDDATFRMARGHGCHVATRPFDTFARQRNFAAQLARGDWVLSIDADERPAAGMMGELRERLACCREAAFRLPIRSRIFGHPFRYSGTQDDRPVRLWRRGLGVWQGEVHETLEVDGLVGRLCFGLEHETLPDLQAFLGKMERYTSLAARARVRRGDRPQWADRFVRPPREVFRRLVWKRGLLDGPRGWGFGLLSGLSEWVLAVKHARYWQRSEATGAHRRHDAAQHHRGVA